MTIVSFVNIVSYLGYLIDDANAALRVRPFSAYFGVADSKPKSQVPCKWVVFFFLLSFTKHVLVKMACTNSESS